ncbi:hypothetical protein N665_0212s0026 [Sinapis alba]|nr:hypothetical protein N665_0212s0026 [Sinapis alba]
MEIQSNCDLELRLHHPSYESSSSEIPQPKKESQLCVSSDLLHLQAKAILSLASRDMEERSDDGSDTSTIRSSLYRVHHQKESMKRSLRSFLQKRNVRIQASCPYRRFPISLFI